MLQAMAHPYGILTVKQMKLAKTFARLLGISDARQKLEMRAVYASLESKRYGISISYQNINTNS
jgi:hypothetical protein